VNTNSTPNTDTVTAIAVIVVTNTAADIWSAIAAGELSRDMILADYRRADERHNRVIDQLGDMLDAGVITFADMKAACDDEDAILAEARKRRDMALGVADEFVGEVA
jgi:hypothetical protein